MFLTTNTTVLDQQQLAAMKSVEKECILDAEELIEVILPRCAQRPRLYNDISNLAQRLYKQAGNLSFFQASCVLYIPTCASGGVEERYKDAIHLDELILVEIRNLRPTNKARLAILQRQLHEQVQKMQQEQIATASTKLKELANLHDTMSLLLARFDTINRPHIHNWIVLQLNHLQTEIMTLQRLTPSQEVSLFERLSLPWSTTNTCSPLDIVPEESQTAEDRWMDVVVLDEMLDTLGDADSPAHDIVAQFKRRCQAEAKRMQRNEAPVEARSFHFETRDDSCVREIQMR